MKTTLCLLALFAGFLNHLPPQSIDTTARFPPVRFGMVVPTTRYIRLAVGEKQIDPESPVAMNPEEIRRLRLAFLRDSLSTDDGAQFLKVTTAAANRNQHVVDNNIQFASHSIAWRTEQLTSWNFNAMAAKLLHIQVDSLGEWGYIATHIEPEQDIVKYYGRIKNKLE